MDRIVFEEGLVEDFKIAVSALGLSCAEVTVENQLAPHTPHKLPRDKCAVYVFSLSSAYGSLCPAGRGRILKVGKAGPNSNARFQYQHYNAGSAQSTLCCMLTEGRILWRYLGIVDLCDDAAGEWIKANTDRHNIYLPASSNVPLLDLLERCIRGPVGPVFEG